jgi:X-X-X-Leu-X-X-Gly heptad repeat protein
LEVDFKATGTSQHILNVNDGTANNRILIYVFASNTLIYIDANGSNVLNTGASSLSDGVQKLAFAYANGDQELYRNGSSIATGTGSLTALATLTDIDLGQSEVSASQANMWIRAVALYPKRLSDAEAQALTTL